MSTLQEDHYDSISDKYLEHYGDPVSTQYRHVFINEPLFQGIDLSGAKVLEAMCGSGQTTDFLLLKGAHVTGLDISDGNLELYRQNWPQCEVILSSIQETGIPDETFDCVCVIGGLHHTHPDVKATMREINRILKPGGYLCFCEPHAGSFPDVVRKLWYKMDSYFAPNEAAIDVQRLQDDSSSMFCDWEVEYGGSLAYIMLLNSLILRYPLSVKRFISRPLMFLEKLVKPLLTKMTTCFVLGRARKI